MVEREHSGSARLDCPLKLGIAAVAAALALAGCTGAEPTGTGQAPQADGIQSSGPLDPELQSVLPQDVPTEAEGGPAQEPAEDGADHWGSYGTATDACAAVAGGVAAITLAPLNLLSGVDEGQVHALEAELSELARRAPSDLQRPLVDIRVEIGRHEGLEGFDHEAFQDALDPLDDWLDTNCSF